MGNKLNKVPEKGTETNLFVLAGDEEAQTPFGWDDMPEFDQPEKGQYALIRVRFRNEEDLREEWVKTQQEESKAITDLQEKYGKVNINLDSGEINES